MLYGKVFLTGGSGYLGRAIMRRAMREDWPCSFTVYSRDELKQAQCRRKYPAARYLLGDVRDTERLALAMTGHDLVVHTAALKYVPEGEYNVSECLSVNVGGTQSVISAARLADVNRLVVISTDKAVAPNNVYGMTKALCERLVGETASYEGGAIVTAVRYGNVIGSTGSVVPEFERQYVETGSVRVTDPDMTRFWMKADDAIDLIVSATSAKKGEILVGVPMAMELGVLVNTIVPRARWEITGLRPGEKMHETLLTEDESLFSVFDDNVIFYTLPPISKRECRSSAYAHYVMSNGVPKISSDDFLNAVVDSHTV